MNGAGDLAATTMAPDFERDKAVAAPWEGGRA